MAEMLYLYWVQSNVNTQIIELKIAKFLCHGPANVFMNELPWKKNVLYY